MDSGHTSSVATPNKSTPNKSTNGQRPSLGKWRRGMLLSGLGLLLLIVLIWLAGTWAKANLASQYPAPGQLIAVGGYKLHLDCRGQGSPTVLLEAGLNDFSVQWARVQPAVAQFTRVCTYDRAGLGWSDPSPHPRTMATMVQELRHLLDQGGIPGPYVLVGHSFGGITMRHFAHEYRDAVVGMVLVDAAHEAQLARLSGQSRTIEQLVQQFRVLALLNRWGLLALSPAQIPNRDLPEAALAQYRARLAVSGYFDAAVAESAAFSLNLGHGSLPHPDALGDLPLIVISRGQAEPLPGLSASQNAQNEQSWRNLQAELVSLSSHSQQWIAEQSGHNIHLQQPMLVIQAIRGLVESTQSH